MVDEFSNFARMPKPVFREENVHEIARQALFLHEVAHPGISFVLDPPEGEFAMVCDRRQLGQALTNVVKNGVEAIEGRQESRRAQPCRRPRRADACTARTASSSSTSWTPGSACPRTASG